MTHQLAMALGWLSAAGAAPVLDGPVSAVGDGKTAVALYMLEVPADAKVEASAGRITRLAVYPDHSAHLVLVPPRVAVPLQVRIVAKSARQGGVVYARFNLQAEPDELDGARSDGPLGIRAPRLYAGGGPGDVEILRGDGEYALVVSAGKAGAFQVRGERLAAALTPPKEGYPQAVIVAVVDGRGEVRDWVAVPLYGLAQVETLTEPDASVEFRVGTEEFGPVRTDERGRARMMIRAPPGVAAATAVVRDRVGNVRETSIDLGAPPVEPVLAICSGSGDRVAVLAVDALGAPVRGAQISFGVSGVTLGPTREVSPGRYEATVLTLAAAPQELRAAIAGRTGQSSCQLPAAKKMVLLPPSLPPSPPPLNPLPHRLSLAARLGYFATPGRLAAPIGVLELAWGPPAPGWLGVGAEVGFTGVVGHFTADAESFFARSFAVPVLARASFRPWRFLVTPYAGVGAGALLVWGTTASARTGTMDFAQLLPSAALHVGAEWKMGPGQVTAELSYVRGWAAGFGASEQLDGLLLTGGYRFER